MKCFIITMFGEAGTVNQTIKNIRAKISDAMIIVVRSENVSVLDGHDKEIVLPNLALTTKRYEIAARAITRNYSAGFAECYKTIKTGDSLEYVIAITGDTLVTDPLNFYRRYCEMCSSGKVLACSQAIGQNFHSTDSDPENGKCGGRFQFDGISDFMPQMFIVDGTFALVSRAFSDIELTNPYTSEQCLGDEFVKHIRGPFKERAMILAQNAYQYSDGVKYHYGRVK